MKKTLYQILGVGPKASAEEIAAAYDERVQELIFATIQDPNKGLVLQQAKEILLDPRQRASYDASIAVTFKPAPRQIIEQEPSSGFFQSLGKWLVPGVILVGVIIWWARRDSPPPVPAFTPAVATSEQAEAQQPAASTLEAAQANEPAAPMPAQESAVPSVVANAKDEPAADTSLGQWSCLDPISGRTDRYNFQADETLIIDSADGPRSFKYQRTGSVLTLSDSKQSRMLRIEDSAPRKMILNTGSEGRRLVCTR